MDKTSLILSVVGPDRPGLVLAISEEVAAAGGDWLDSRMATLAGKFAGVVQVAVPAEQAEPLAQRLRALDRETQLRVSVDSGAPPAAAGGRLVQLALLGQDHPGIVRDIARLLATKRVSVEELDTGTVSGAFSGESMFKASARLRVPAELPTAELRGLLEALANELMVDVTIEEKIA